jgi:hypothetical protein
VWFRLSKWVVFVGLGVMFWRERAFWWCAGAAALLGVALHLLYRRQTRRWTRAWGGCDDLEAGRGG